MGRHGETALVLEPLVPTQDHRPLAVGPAPGAPPLRNPAGRTPHLPAVALGGHVGCPLPFDLWQLPSFSAAFSAWRFHPDRKIILKGGDKRKEEREKKV